MAKAETMSTPRRTYEIWWDISDSNVPLVTADVVDAYSNTSH